MSNAGKTADVHRQNEAGKTVESRGFTTVEFSEEFLSLAHTFSLAFSI